MLARRSSTGFAAVIRRSFSRNESSSRWSVSTSRTCGGSRLRKLPCKERRRCKSRQSRRLALGEAGSSPLGGRESSHRRPRSTYRSRIRSSPETHRSGQRSPLRLTVLLLLSIRCIDLSHSTRQVQRVQAAAFTSATMNQTSLVVTPSSSRRRTRGVWRGRLRAMPAMTSRPNMRRRKRVASWKSKLS